MTRLFNRQGKPLGLKAWKKLYDDPAYRQIAKTRLVDGTFISTIWLGLDHRYGFEGEPSAPVIFETMVFCEDDAGDHDMERYTSEEDAKTGHELMVQKWEQRRISPRTAEA